MRFLWFLLFCVLISACKTAGRKVTYINVCEEFIFDLSDGTLNGVKPKWPQSEIKEWLPCYTKFVPDGEGDAYCGGAILYENHDFYFYTYLDNYIEIGPGFKGKVSDDLLNKSRKEVRDLLGTPVEHPGQDAFVDFFSAPYGCIRVEYKDNLAVVIAAHYASCEETGWCK